MRRSLVSIRFISSIRNLDLDLDSNSLNPSRIGGRATNLKPSRRESIASIEFISSIRYLDPNTLSLPRIDGRGIHYFKPSRTLYRIYFLNLYQSLG